jgi:hypothetical protein
MSKKLALLLVVVLIASMVFVACDQTEEYAAKESKLPARATAVEDNYKVATATVLKFGKEVVYPLMKDMENLEKSRMVNGALSTRGIKIGTDVDGNPGMVFSTYKILVQNKDILSIKFYASEKMNAQDEAVNFLFAATKQGKLFMNVANIFGKTDTNDNMNELFAVFNAYREQEGMEEITLDEFYFAVIAFKGDDSKNLDMEISYLKDHQNTITIPFSEVIGFLLPEDAEYFSFAY